DETRRILKAIFLGNPLGQARHIVEHNVTNDARASADLHAKTRYAFQVVVGRCLTTVLDVTVLFDFQQEGQGFPESFDKVAQAHGRGLQDRRNTTVGVLHFSTRVLASESDWMLGAGPSRLCRGHPFSAMPGAIHPRSYEVCETP